MKSRESKYVKKLIATLSDYLIVKISDRYVRGLLDLWGVKKCDKCGCGKLFLLEEKAEDGTLSDLQRRTIREYRKFGVLAEECREGSDTETIQRLREY